MLTSIAKKELARDTMAMCTERMAQRVTHEEYLDWMGTMEAKYPGIGWEQAAVELDGLIRRKAVLTVRL